MTDKVWFITGASRGFGRIWAEAALARGDGVAATARDAASVADLAERFGGAALPLALDVTSPEQVRQAVARAHDRFGRLDVVVNNAGYTLVGTVEEASEAEVRAIFDTNLFGALAVIQAALPLLRAQGSGRILGVSSGMGVVAMPLAGFYCASKWAFEALHESLAQEVRGHGIRVTLLEPGAYATEFSSPALAEAHGRPRCLCRAPPGDERAAVERAARRSAGDRGRHPPDRRCRGPAAAVRGRQHRPADGPRRLRRAHRHLGGLGRGLGRGPGRAENARHHRVLMEPA